jgi:glycosyltransferase involved in cell wall biosynthesis
MTDARAFGEVRSLLSSRPPAILHTHMAKAGTVGRLAARTMWHHRPRTVHTFHGHVLDGYFSRTAQRTFIEVERRLARSTDVLVAVSPEVRDELLDLKIGRSSQYRVIPLGLELEPFLAVTAPSGRLRAALGLQRDVPLVGVVGRLVAIKALDVLIAAMQQLPATHLAIIGDGEERSVLEQCVRDHALTARVHFTGWSPDLVADVSDLDVVALSSRNEGTPVALIEALAARRPVVATDVGGVRHVVVSGQTGLLVRPGDATALAEAVRTLLDKPDLALQLATAGRSHVQASFGSERLVSDIRGLYHELVG